MESTDEGTSGLAYEWCADGIAPLMDEFRGAAADVFRWWRERRQRCETIHIQRVDDLPEDGTGKALLQACGIQCVLEVLLLAAGPWVGSLGISSHRQRSWSNDAVILLTMAGEMFVNALQRQRGEQERAALEDKLREMQKLDAVGRLAGGIAHDFNNQLTIIKGCAQFLLAGLPDEDALRLDAQRIAATADRGAHLVRQLLAFNSATPNEPQSLDLTRLVQDMAPMLR